MAATEPDLLSSREAGPAALRGSAVRSGAYLAGVALSLASAPLLVRHLGVVDFGAYVTVVSLMNLVAGVTEGGLNAIALREYATLEPGARERALRSLLGVRWVLSLAGLAVGLAFAFAADYRSALVVGAVGAGIGVLLQALQTLLTVPLQGELRFGRISVLDLLRQVLTVALIVAFVLADAGLVPFLWATAPAALLVLVVTAWMVRGTMPLRPSLRLGEWWPLLRDTLPFTAAIALQVVYFRIAVLVMSVRASDLQTGYFATSFRIVEVLITIPALVIGAAYPILARAHRDDAERFRYAMRRILELAVILGTWMTVCLVTGAPVAIEVLAGSEGGPAVEVLRLQGCAFLFTAVAVAASFGLLTLRRHTPMLWANGLALVLVVGLSWTLAPAHGAQGAAVAALAAEAAVACVLTAILVRERPALAAGLSGAPLIVAVGGGAIAVGLLLPSLPGLLVANVVFVAGLVAVRRFPPEVRDMLRR